MSSSFSIELPFSATQREYDPLSNDFKTNRTVFFVVLFASNITFLFICFNNWIGLYQFWFFGCFYCSYCSFVGIGVCLSEHHPISKAYAIDENNDEVIGSE